MCNYKQFSFNPTLPIDNANGYSMLSLQSYLSAKPINWYMYRDYLKDNSTNPTETAAVQLFSDYD